MDVPVWILDDGAWISVDDSREVGVSDLWRLADHEFCGCETADVLVEAFFEVRPSGNRVEARAVGHCITCGERGSMGWLTVGRVEDGRFVPADPEGEHSVVSA
ncbi:MAG: hypothetical protein QXG03_05185 [Halalkalicoccus sp.]